MSNADASATPPSFRELEVLGALIRLRKTTSAAMSLGVSQPAISRALAQLEARLGRPLFTRDGGRLAPTAEALALNEQAQPILAAFARLAGWPNAAAEADMLRVAASPTLAHHVLPPVVAAFRAVAPSVTVQVEIGTNTAVVAAVADRLADVGVTDTPAPHPAVAAQVFRLARAHCVMPEGHRLAAFDEITVRELDGEPLVALARRFSSRTQVDSAFADAGLSPRIVAEASTSAFAVELVRQGVGVALINPYPLSPAGMGGLTARPFSPMISYRTALLFPAIGGASSLARRFADLLTSLQPEDGLTNAIR
jgi:DNA-binding transcriptional LysR family regulator